MVDILIRGMKMPKDRSLWLLIRPDGTVFKIKDNDKLGLPQEGPAIFLPEGHGRLIDADKLMEKGMTLSWSAQKWVQEVDIICAPTIVPAEGGNADGN